MGAYLRARVFLLKLYVRGFVLEESNLGTLEIISLIRMLVFLIGAGLSWVTCMGVGEEY